MKRFSILLAAALLLAACGANDKTPAEEGWVKVEGNRFIDPQGNEIIFRGLCFSDPVKLVREQAWNERYVAEAAS